MILVIDTSSAVSALALLDGSGAVVREALHPSGRTFDLPARYRELTQADVLTQVAVATGPGSFTGLRVGVSFGLGLAIGLKIPILPLRTLALQAARIDRASLAVAEAGRGRVYFLSPGGQTGVAEPDQLPHGLPLVGWLRPETEEALTARGLSFAPEAEQRSFGAAAAKLLGSATEVPYGSLRLEYMQSFSRPRA